MALQTLFRSAGAAHALFAAGRTVAVSLGTGRALAATLRTVAITEADLKPPQHGASVVLVNGSVESAALLSYWHHHDHAQKLLPLFIRYGQRNSFEQEAAARAVSRHFGLALARIDAGFLGDQLKALTAPRSRYGALPLHDPLLLTLGAAYAEEAKATHQVLCLSREDLSSGAAALRHAQDLLHLIDPPQSLLAPLAGMTRGGVIQLGQQAGAPWHLTYSCTEGSKGGGSQLPPGVPGVHCGKCEHCQDRQAAFAAARVQDTAVYAG